MRVIGHRRKSMTETYPVSDGEFEGIEERFTLILTVSARYWRRFTSALTTSNAGLGRIYLTLIRTLGLA